MLAALFLFASIVGTLGVCRRGEGQLWSSPPDPYRGRTSGPVTYLTGARLWPNATIPFTIDGDFTQRERDGMERALRAIHQNTCVRFVPNLNCERRDSVHATNDSPFTFDIGYSGGPQRTGLAWSNLRDLSQSTHQLFHVLGFNHEEQRPDAAQHVSGPFQFCGVGRPTRLTYVNTLDDFDYDTVMLRLGYIGGCGRDVQARDQPINENTIKMLGRKNGPSQLDYRKINIAYGCTEFL